jgi:hypothetical protein
VTTKDPSSNIVKDNTFTNQAKAKIKPKVEVNSQSREVYSQAYKKAISSAGPVLRSDTRDKPVNTYPDMHPKARNIIWEEMQG